MQSLAPSHGVKLTSGCSRDIFSVMGDPYNCALALHTSSSELGLAVLDASGTVRWQTWNLGRELSTQLHCCLQDFLSPYSWDQLTWLAIACGPGSFTSTRMGVVVARTLAQQLDIPLFAVSSLAAIAWEHRQIPPLGNDFAIQMPAQRGETYGAIYRLTSATDQSLPSLQPVLPDAVMSLTEWQHLRSSWTQPHHLIAADDILGKSVTSVLELAHIAWQQGLRPHWSTVTPFYGQHPVERLATQ